MKSTILMACYLRTRRKDIKLVLSIETGRLILRPLTLDDAETAWSFNREDTDAKIKEIKKDAR